MSESQSDEQPAVAVDAVERLAAVADLPLTAGRRTAVSDTLSAWLPGVNELSRKMSDPAHQTVTPVTVFTHPPVEEDLL